MLYYLIYKTRRIHVWYTVCPICYFNFNSWSTVAFVQVVHAFRSEHAGKGGSGDGFRPSSQGTVGEFSDYLYDFYYIHPNLMGCFNMFKSSFMSSTRPYVIILHLSS